MHRHGGLVVVSRAEDLAAPGRDRRVALDDGRGHPAQGLDAQGQRRHVQQQHVLDLAAQDAALQSRADRHHFVGVDPLVRLLAAGQAAHQLLHHRHASRAAYQHHLVDLCGRQLGGAQGRLEGAAQPGGQGLAELLELAAAQRHLQVLGAAGVSCDEGQVDLGLDQAGQLDLGLLGRFLQALQGLAIAAQVDALLLLERVGDVIDQHLVVVVAAQVGVAGRGLDLDHTVAHLQDRHVKGAAAQVEDQDRLVAFLVQAIGQRGRGRLVDDAQNLQASDLAGVLGGLALAVVEVGRHGDHGLRHRLAQIGFGVGLELAQDHRADLLGGKGFVFDRDAHARVVGGAFHDLVGDALVARLVEAPAHEALDAGHGVFGVDHGLAPCGLAHQPLATLGEGHHRRRRPSALGVGDHHRVAALDYRHHRIRRTQVDTNDLTHVQCSFWFLGSRLVNW